jgi:colanic acid/amylovoran biosynthesis glycosyltransferase
MPLRVGYVLEPPYPTFWLAEIEAVRQAGAEVVVFNSFRPFPQAYPAAEATRQASHYFPARYSGVVGASAHRALFRPGAMARVIAFVLRHGLGMRLVALAAYYARVVQEQGIQHLHAGFGTTPATVAMLTAWLSGRPYSFTLHAYDVFLPNPLLPEKARGARFYTTISHFNREYIQAAYPEVDTSRLEVVHLGVDVDAWTPRPAEPTNAVPLCACVANLITCKGHHVLLEAAAILKQEGTPLHCLVIGDGEQRGRLEDLARTLGLADLVTFAGRLDSAAVRASLRRSDVFALPAVVAEQGNHDGLPVALMEAMACGVPVVSSQLSGIPELVIDGVTGLLTVPGDAAALARALRSLLVNAPLRQSLTRAARERVVAEFDIAKTAARMVQLFAGQPARGIPAATTRAR